MPSFREAWRARLRSDADLTAIDGARVHWNVVPKGSGYPHTRMQVISGPRPRTMKGFQGSRLTRVRVEVMTPDLTAAEAILERIVQIAGSPGEQDGVRFGGSEARELPDGGEDLPDGFINRLSVDLLIQHSVT